MERIKYKKTIYDYKKKGRKVFEELLEFEIISFLQVHPEYTLDFLGDHEYNNDGSVSVFIHFKLK